VLETLGVFVEPRHDVLKLGHMRFDLADLLQQRL
jgi:hypothetical protein